MKLFLSRLETTSTCNVKTFLFSLWNGQVHLSMKFTSSILFLCLFSYSDKDMNMTPGNPPSLSYLYQLVFGLYMLVTTVVLINLLIAMMSDTYQRIQVTWNFLYSPFQTRRIWCNTITSSLHFYPLFNSNNLMWNGSLDWQNLSDQCTELTCHHLLSILSPLGLFICSGCVGKVSN